MPITPISAAEHRRLDKRIKKKHEKLRRRYPEVHGKKVDWISHGYAEGYLFFNVRFTDGKNFNKRYSYIAEALGDLPADTVVDGEIVALDDSGRPDFHRLQHFGAEAARIQYFVFDLLISTGVI